MPHEKLDCLFHTGVRTLGQVLRNTEFPFIVKTRNQLSSFHSDILQTEGSGLCLEGEVDIEYAHVKVLPFNNDKGRVSDSLVELSIFQNDFAEFYIPVNYPGGLKIQTYPGKRQRFASVEEVIDQRPRYLRSHVDTMAISTKGTGRARMKCIERDSVVRVVDIVQTASFKRVLKCMNKSGRFFLLKENARVNFTAVPDEQVYTLRELQETRTLLPVPIQFVHETINPDTVAHFYSETSNNVAKLAQVKLELLQFVTVRNVVGRMFDNASSSLKTLVLPSTLFDEFHVQLAEFKNPEEKLDFMSRHFGEAIYGNDVIDGKMFFVPVDGKLVTWLKCQYALEGEPTEDENLDGCDNYEPPPDVDDVTSVKGDISKQDFYSSMRLQPLSTGVNTESMHIVELQPQTKIQDQNVLKKIIEKTKLGFGHVHKELIALFYRNNEQNQDHKEPKTSEPEEDAEPNCFDAYAHLVDCNPATKQESLVTDDKEDTASIDTTNEDELPPPVPRRSSVCVLAQTSITQQTLLEKELPIPLPRRVFLQENLTQDQDYEHVLPIPPPCRLLSQDNVTHDFENEHASPPRSPRSGSSKDNIAQEMAQKTLSKQGLSSQHNRRRAYPCLPPPPEITKQQRKPDLSTQVTKQDQRASDEHKYMEMFPVDLVPELSSDNNKTNIIPTTNSNVSRATETSNDIPDESFESYTISETAACFRQCGLDGLAVICEEHFLDGYFMKHLDPDILTCEPFYMNKLQIDKLRLILVGWRPKH